MVNEIKCPYCDKMLQLRGAKGHVRFKHADKIEEYNEHYQDWKDGVWTGTAVKTAAKQPESKPEPQTPPAQGAAVPPGPSSNGGGKPKPEEGKSFLERILGPD